MYGTTSTRHLWWRLTVEEVPAETDSGTGGLPRSPISGVVKVDEPRDFPNKTDLEGRPNRLARAKT